MKKKERGKKRIIDNPWDYGEGKQQRNTAWMVHNTMALMMII